MSITVATLQELGHLKSFLGTTIVSAAVIDDVIGIIVLTCVLGASSGEGTGIGGQLLGLADAFGAAHAFLMVGGTTSSVQSMVLTACKRGDEIILPRNVHRSVLLSLIHI